MYYNLYSIILKRQDFREDDLLITVYSLEKGKVILLARGAKKIKSKLAGHLEPVSLSYLNVTAGRTRDQLIGAQIIQSYQKIKKDFDKIQTAGQILKLVDDLTRENLKDERIFSLLKKSLDFLNRKRMMSGDKLAKTEISGFDQKRSLLSRNYADCNAELREKSMQIVKIAFGFKLLHLLGLSPVKKKGFKWAAEVEFVVKNNIWQIISNKNIKERIDSLEKILEGEVENLK